MNHKSVLEKAIVASKDKKNMNEKKNIKMFCISEPFVCLSNISSSDQSPTAAQQLTLRPGVSVCLFAFSFRSFGTEHNRRQFRKKTRVWRRRI